MAMTNPANVKLKFFADPRQRHSTQRLTQKHKRCIIKKNISYGGSSLDYYTRALELKDETIAHRRYIHQNAEIGLDLPKTTAYVLAQLKSLGIEPEMCGHGITATIGQGSKTILLRADMDALPMQELSGEAFACPSGAAHACGHDFHAAMLLTAAKMLKENETSLKGTVKLMFQPAEECFSGSTDMIKHGILADSADVALAYHVSPGRLPVGLYMYNSKGTMMNSVRRL